MKPLEPGTVLKDGKYYILELTNNNGGFGRIYRARYLDNTKKCEVAIKEYHIQDFDYEEWSKMHSMTVGEMEIYDADMRSKFMNEASNLEKLYGLLEDKHIPEVIDTVWLENGRMFYAMEFINGKTLKETMRDAMSERKAVGCIIQIAKVLHKAHRLGLVHADVSPNNIMLKKWRRDYAVLVDWGNAMSYNDGYGIGTEGFRAPAAFWGTPQTDVYSLAATLLYLLTKKVPKLLDCEDNIEKTIDLLAYHNVSAETIDAILHAMNIDAEKATKTIHEFVMDLPKDIALKVLLNYTDNDI